MGGIFKGEIKGKIIKEGNVVLIVVPATKLIKMNTQLLKQYISEKKYPLVYVTVNKPFSTLVEHFQERKIDTSKIFIIDAISPRTQRAGNAVFVGNPKGLTNISITTTSTLKKLKTAKVLIFDSISTLLVYNKFEVVKDFIIFITKEMKNLKVTFVMNVIKDKTDKNVLSQLSAFVDEVIDIEQGFFPPVFSHRKTYKSQVFLKFNRDTKKLSLL